MRIGSSMSHKYTNLSFVSQWKQGAESSKCSHTLTPSKHISPIFL